MKTTVKSVEVELIDDGRRVVRRYSIATKSGELMTHRLEKILNGNVIRNHEERLDAHYGDWHEIQFIGMVWQPPYQLLREIAEDRTGLQRELFSMEGASDLTEYPTLDVPMKECSCKISELILTELNLRKKLKTRLAELDQIKARKDSETDMTGGAICTAWELASYETSGHDTVLDSSPDDDLWKPDITCAPKPYAW